MSGSGQDSGFMKAMSDPSLQRYLVNMGTGMAGGRTLADSLAGGLQMAGQGLLKDMDTEQRKKMVKDVLSDTDLSSLDPMAIQQKGLELIGSGDPSLAAIGQHLVTTAISKQPSAEWRTTAVDVGGKQVPAQQNIKTGEIKPFSADLMYGPKVTWNSDLRQYEDVYGNPVSKPNTPVSQLQDSSISSKPATTPTANVSTAQPIFNVTPAPAGATPKEAYDWRKSQIEQQQKVEQEIAKEQRGLEQGKTQIINEAAAKNEVAAREFFTPEAVQSRQSMFEANKEDIDALEAAIKARHEKYGKLADINQLAPVLSAIGDTTYSDVRMLANRILASTIQNLKSSGSMTAGMMNSEKELQVLKDSIADPDMPYDTLMKQVGGLRSKVNRAEKAMKAREETMRGYLTNKPNAPSEPTDTPNIVKGGDGKYYMKLPNGNYRLVQ